MWMEVHIYSVKAKSQTGNIRVKGIMTTQKGQSWKKVLRVLLGLRIYISEYTWKVAVSAHQKVLQFYLVVQRRVQLEHSSHIVQVGTKATC